MSSNAAVTSNPNWPQDRLKDESCWSDTEFCKEKEVSNSSARLNAATCHSNKQTSKCTLHKMIDGDVYSLLVSLLAL